MYVCVGVGGITIWQVQAYLFCNSGPPLVPINNVAQPLPSGRLSMQSYHAVVKRKCSAYSNPITLVPNLQRGAMSSKMAIKT